MSTHFEQRLYPAADAADKESCRPDFAVALYHRYGIGLRPLLRELHRQVDREVATSHNEPSDSE
jgi:hypothetical protein